MPLRDDFKTPLDPETEAALIAAIQEAFRVGRWETRPVDRGTARRLAVAAEPLWEALEAEGWVDTFARAECRRVLPDALLFIRGQANADPHPQWDLRDEGKS